MSIRAKIEIEAPLEQSFEYIVPVELSHIMPGYKSLPGVERTSNKTLWYTPGMQRTVHFTDGNTAIEKLLTVEPHASFSYQVDGFTSVLKRLAVRVEGEWQFHETPQGNTHIEWRYTLVPRNGMSRFVLNTFVKKDVQGFLNQALAILKEDLEQ